MSVTALAAVRRPATATPRLTVDLDAVAANVRLLAAHCGRDLMAVVKADGFGHGVLDVARVALANGATWLGVTSLAEARPLRAAALSAPLLSWLNPVDADWESALLTGIDVACPDLEHLAAIAGAAHAVGTSARVHLHLDTGLARDGAAPADWPALTRAARRAELAGLVRVVGLMGHLACADQPGHPDNQAGRDRFAWGLQTARAAGLRPGHRHLAATAATLSDPASRFTMSRVGAGLVGIDPSGTTALHPALTLTAPVVGVRRVAAGTPVGYGHTWTAPASTTLALLPVGYADGLPRSASHRAEVLLGGRRRRLVGRISMDQVVADLGDDPVALGDEATVFGTGPTAPTTAPTTGEWAQWAGVLEHEIVTGLGHRVPRVTTW